MGSHKDSFITIRPSRPGEGSCSVCRGELDRDEKRLVYPDKGTVYTVTFDDPSRDGTVFLARYCEEDLTDLARQLATWVVTEDKTKEYHGA